MSDYSDSLGEEEEEEHQSGANRLCNSIVGAVCCAPLIIIGTIFLFAWNEKSAVCKANAYLEGRDVVQQVPCTSSKDGTDGELVHFSCNLEKQGLPTFAADGDFVGYLSFQGTGLSTKSEMLQCMEHESSETKKTSGGGKQTTTTYSYTLDWADHYIDSSSFSHKSDPSWQNNCGAENPMWGAGIPKTGARYAETADVGPFTIPHSFVQQVPLTTPVTTKLNDIPYGWKFSSGGYYISDKWKASTTSLGQVRVSFYGNDWAHPATTVLGQNNHGTIGPWKASATWLCSGSLVWDLSMGVFTVDSTFTDLETQAAMLTWLLRLLGFGLLWCAFAMMLSPFEVMADCIPCCGPCLGDIVEKLTCAISCFPACTCSLGLIGIFWVAVRPMFGIPMLMLLLCTVCGGCCYLGPKALAKIEGKGVDHDEESASFQE